MPIICDCLSFVWVKSLSLSVCLSLRPSTFISTSIYVYYLYIYLSISAFITSTNTFAVFFMVGFEQVKLLTFLIWYFQVLCQSAFLSTSGSHYSEIFFLFISVQVFTVLYMSHILCSKRMFLDQRNLGGLRQMHATVHFNSRKLS